MVWDTKETLCTVAIVAVAQLLSCVQLFVIPGTAAQLFSSVAQSCPTLYDPMNCSMPGLPVHHQLLDSKVLEFQL